MTVQLPPASFWVADRPGTATRTRCDQHGSVAVDVVEFIVLLSEGVSASEEIACTKDVDQKRNARGQETRPNSLVCHETCSFLNPTLARHTRGLQSSTRGRCSTDGRMDDSSPLFRHTVVPQSVLRPIFSSLNESNSLAVCPRADNQPCARFNSIVVCMLVIHFLFVTTGNVCTDIEA